MNFNEYQQETYKTNIYPNEHMIDCLILGLCSEAGEVASLRKKSLRDGFEITEDKIKAELGDCLWYISEIAAYYNISLQEIAEGNITKLWKRYKKGTIQGEGDER